MPVQKFQITNENLIFIQKKRRSFNYTRFFGPFIFILLNLAFVYSFGIELIVSITLFSILTILTTAFCIVIPKKAINKLDKLVTSFEIRNDFIDFQSLNEKTSIPKQNVITRNTVIKIINKDHVVNEIIYNGKVYHIVMDYFQSEIEDFIDSLNQK
jgi:hypothetical protein